MIQQTLFEILERKHWGLNKEETLVDTKKIRRSDIDRNGRIQEICFQLIYSEIINDWERYSAKTKSKLLQTHARLSYLVSSIGQFWKLKQKQKQKQKQKNNDNPKIIIAMTQLMERQ